MKTKVKIPSNWSEINLNQLILLNKIQEGVYASQVEMNSEILQVLSGENKDYFLSLPLSQFVELVNNISWISNLPTKVIKTFQLQGIKYVPVDLSNITTGEYISIDVLMKELNKNFHLIISILIRPVGVDGKIEPLKDMTDISNRANLFMTELKADIIWPIISNFFSGAASLSSNNTQVSSKIRKK